jgi:excisionase family DNA binding protein
MQLLFYSTGQVARQLGTTLATIRVLCENHLITAETTAGGHWRVPSSEVERLKRDGLPPIPRPLPSNGTAPAGNRTRRNDFHPEPFDDRSPEVASAANDVVITRSKLEKRKIERELEENEDWFRDRQQRHEAEEASAIQEIESKNAERRHREWVEQWMQYALNSLPYEARREVEMEVHHGVQEALSELPPNQPESITKRLVDAAVHKALRPWNRKQQIERALQAGMNSLPWDIQYGSRCGSLRQRAWEVAAAAVGRLREEARYHEMEIAAEEAVQPIVQEYEHQEACRRIVRLVYVCGATSEEREAAEEAVRQALEALPIGAGRKQLEQAEETALVPYKAAVAARKEKARLQLEEQVRHGSATFKADLYLDHITRHLEEEYDFDGGYSEMRREADRLRPLIREALIGKLLANPNMSPVEIHESIEDQIESTFAQDIRSC